MSKEHNVADKVTDDLITSLEEVRALHYAAQKAVLQRIIDDAGRATGEQVRGWCEGAAALADAVPRAKPPANPRGSNS